MSYGKADQTNCEARRCFARLGVATLTLQGTWKYLEQGAPYTNDSRVCWAMGLSQFSPGSGMQRIAAGFDPMARAGALSLMPKHEMCRSVCHDGNFSRQLEAQEVLCCHENVPKTRYTCLCMENAQHPTNTVLPFRTSHALICLSL